MSRNGWHFGIPLRDAATYVAVADIVLGAIITIGVIVDAIQQGCDRYRYGRIQYSEGVAVLFISCFSTQVVMGFGLYYAILNKLTKIIQLWMCITGLTAYFTGMPFRIYEMLIVNEFLHELGEEEGDATNVRGRTSSSQLQGNCQIEMSSSSRPRNVSVCPIGNKNDDKDGLIDGGEEMAIDPNPGTSYEGSTRENGYCQQCHQPVPAVPAPPATNQHGRIAKGHHRHPSYNYKYFASPPIVPPPDTPPSSTVQPGPPSPQDSQDGDGEGPTPNIYPEIPGMGQKV